MIGTAVSFARATQKLYNNLDYFYNIVIQGGLVRARGGLLTALSSS
jgi:hypothetical protein